jgi:hypothetical protein
MSLLSTSKGVSGESTILEIDKNRFPFRGADLKGSFYLPNFNDNFDTGKGIIINKELDKHLLKIIDSIEI